MVTERNKLKGTDERIERWFFRGVANNGEDRGLHRPVGNAEWLQEKGLHIRPNDDGHQKHFDIFAEGGEFRSRHTTSDRASSREVVICTDSRLREQVR